ncbi:MAG: hypothetical protein JSS99_16515 [Actinobacteria bacterium]|nr:hypothetical protein [Actinomycetota bacterium]
MSERHGGALARLSRAWRALAPEGRLAAGAALALFVTMLLPWYQQNAVVSGRGEPLVSRDLSAFQVFTFVEAAVLLVALAVLALLFARAEDHAFHLPGGDGTVVMGAGIWVVLLLVWRLFDKPGISTRGVAANVGIQWGIFFALGAAGLLTYAGSRMRSAARPEPPAREPRRRPRPPVRAEEPVAASPPPPPGTTTTQVLPPERPRRPRAPAAPDEQLTIPLPPAED